MHKLPPSTSHPINPNKPTWDSLWKASFPLLMVEGAQRSRVDFFWPNRSCPPVTLGQCEARADCYTDRKRQNKTKPNTNTEVLTNSLAPGNLEPHDARVGMSAAAV